MTAILVAPDSATYSLSPAGLTAIRAGAEPTLILVTCSRVLALITATELSCVVLAYIIFDTGLMTMSCAMRLKLLTTSPPAKSFNSISYYLFMLSFPIFMDFLLFYHSQRDKGSHNNNICLIPAFKGNDKLFLPFGIHPVARSARLAFSTTTRINSVLFGIDVGNVLYNIHQACIVIFPLVGNSASRTPFNTLFTCIFPVIEAVFM